MASITSHGGVGSDQRKTILVLLDVLDGNLPALDRVAIRAVGSQLPAMDVGMAIGAGMAYVSKHHLGVALRAGVDRGMHATERIPGFVMVEIRQRPDRFPARVGVTRLARKTEATVGASRGGLVRPLLSTQGKRQRHSQQESNSPIHRSYTPFASIVLAIRTW